MFGAEHKVYSLPSTKSETGNLYLEQGRAGDDDSPHESPGWLLEGVGNSTPRQMAVLDRIRLIDHSDVRAAGAPAFMREGKPAPRWCPNLNLTSAPPLQLYRDTRLGTLERWYLGEPRDFRVRIPDDMLQCVCFLAIRQLDGTFKYGGTGLFVSVLSETRQDLSFLYLVTARHCVERAQESGGPLYLRLNTKDGRSGMVEVTPDARWRFPSNGDGADVAVLPWAPPIDLFEYKNIPRKMFATDEAIKEYGIGVGDELVMVGLFTRRHGNQRNSPIVRAGVISSMPDEPFVDDNTGFEYGAYLAEVRSIGGLSGSPVFVFLDPGRVHEKRIELISRRVFLLGLIRGHWDYKRRMPPMDFVGDELEAVNMGISLITPIQDALKIIDGDELREERRKITREKISEEAPTKD